MIKFEKSVLKNAVGVWEWKFWSVHEIFKKSK